MQKRKMLLICCLFFTATNGKGSASAEFTLKVGSILRQMFSL